MIYIEHQKIALRQQLQTQSRVCELEFIVYNIRTNLKRTKLYSVKNFFRLIMQDKEEQWYFENYATINVVLNEFFLDWSVTHIIYL
jgi:hypothetical protein